MPVRSASLTSVNASPPPSCHASSPQSVLIACFPYLQGKLHYSRHYTARLEEAVAAYREALKEFTSERAPYYRNGAQKNLLDTLAVSASLVQGNPMAGARTQR